MRTKSLLITILILTLALTTRYLGSIHVALAATIVVNTTVDELNTDGDCSLREAIQAANLDTAVSGCAAGNGADTITFAAATDGNPIVLGGTAGEDANAGGDLDILDGGDLTIQGNGATNTIVDGNLKDRVFHVCPGGGCANTITFSGVTIRRGVIITSGGGGIRNEAGTTILDACTIRYNGAINGGGISNFATLIIQNGSAIGVAGAGNLALINGGGIYNYAGTLTLDNSTVSLNSADNNGGGIWNQGTLNVQNGSIIGGSGLGNTAEVDGGGIYNFAGTTTVDDSTVSLNSATNNGGGIWNQATLNVQNGSIIGDAGVGNTAEVDGGGIYNQDAGVVTIDGSTVSTNTATYGSGGGIVNLATLTVQNGSSISANAAAYDGGGIYNDDTGDLTVDDSIVSTNTAERGGGIFNDSTLNVQNGSIIGGSGAGNNAIEGGGIYNDANGMMTIDNSTVSANSVFSDGGGINNHGSLNLQNGSFVGGSGAGNMADRGGGIYAAGGVVNVDSSAISHNSAIKDGGGIYSDSSLNVQNGSTIGGSGAGNTADRGGGFFNGESGTAIVDGSTVSANSANSGGGILNDGTLNVQNGSIIGGVGVGNTADLSGGGIYNENDGTTTVDDSTVSANSANSGGGIYNIYGTLNVQNGSLIGGTGEGNTANNNGGGIYNEAGTTKVINSTVGANSANYGGGISNDMHGTTIVDSSTVSINSATNDGGGIYNEVEGALTVKGGSTISANSANYGGGIYTWHDSTTTVTGSRILYNTAATNGGGVYSDINFVEDTSVTGSCIVGNSDTSFFNNQSDEQIATGNWWGAPTGPNTPGADTVEGNVDYSGFLITPILNCGPDLQMNKANDTGGNALTGIPFHWTLTILNTGLFSATFDTRDTILIDELPAGPTYSAPIAGNFVDVANSANIHCSLAGNMLTCEPTGGSVTLGSLTGSFEVTFSVTPSAPVTLVNPVGICQVDPDGDVNEGDESNNNCPTNVVNVTLPVTYLPLVLR